VTPISRPLVKGHPLAGRSSRGATIFLAAPATNSVIGFFKQPCSNRVRFFSLWLRTKDESRQTPIEIKRGSNGGLRPGGFAAPEERWYRAVSKGFSQCRGCRRAGANLRMAYGACDPLSLPLVTAIRRPIQCSWLQPQSPYLARRIVVVRQAKQRETDRQPPGIDNRMNLARQSTSRPAHQLFFVPRNAGPMLVQRTMDVLIISTPAS
jgi:hypothetical protein